MFLGKGDRGLQHYSARGADRGSAHHGSDFPVQLRSANGVLVPAELPGSDAADPRSIPPGRRIFAWTVWLPSRFYRVSGEQCRPRRWPIHILINKQRSRRLSMNLSSMWNGMPGQTQLPAATQHIAQGATIQQPGSMVAAYPVQRFQVS